MRRADLLRVMPVVLGLLAGGCAHTGRAGGDRGPATVTVPSEDPIVTLRLLFETGSIDDPAGREGLTALTARLMERGGTEVRTWPELQETLFPLASTLNVEIDREMTVFRTRVHRDHLDTVAALLVEVLTRPAWKPEAFERVRTEAKNTLEADLKGRSDESLGKEALLFLMYPGHPYGHPVVGTGAGLEAATLEEVRAHAARVFTADRLTVGVAGDAPEGFAQTLTQTLAAALPARGAKKPELPRVPTPDGTRVLLVEKPGPATAISFGFPIDVRRGDADWPALVLAASHLGEHRQFHGRLFQVIRDARGLNYGSYAYVEHFEQDRWTRFARPNIALTQQRFEVWLRPVRHEHRFFALRAAVRELQALVENGLTEAQLERTRRFLVSYLLLHAQTDDRRLGHALDARFYGLSESHLEVLRRGLEALTLDEVNAAVRRHLRFDRLFVAGVTTNGASLRAALRDGRESPIEYDSPKPPEVLAEDEAIRRHPVPVEAVEVVDAAEVF